MHLLSLPTLLTATLLIVMSVFLHPLRILGQAWKHLRRRYTKRGRRARGYGSNY